MNSVSNIIKVENQELSFTIALVLSLISTKVIPLMQIMGDLKTVVLLAYFTTICLDSLVALYAIIKEKVLLQIAIIGSAINLLIWTVIWLAFVVCMYRVL